MLQRPDITIPYLTNTWLTNMRDFMANHNFQIETSNEWSMRRQCENDTMLMEYFASRGVSKYKLCHLNACRMFLQVSSIADIATADGVQIHQNSLECKHITSRRWGHGIPNHPWKGSPNSTKLQYRDKTVQNISEHLDPPDYPEIQYCC